MKPVYNKDPHSRDEERVYLIKGEPYPSATQILSMVSSDYLFAHIQAIKQEVQCLSALAEYSEPYRAWSHTGAQWVNVPIPADELLRDGDFVSNAGLRFSNQAANRGTVLHELTRYYKDGARPSSPEEVDAITMDAVVTLKSECPYDVVVPYSHQLFRLLDALTPDLYFSEYPGYSESGKYAGTPDGFGLFPSISPEPLWFDVKSMATPNFVRSHYAQLAAYANMDFFIPTGPPPSPIFSMPKRPDGTAFGGVILYISPDSCGYRRCDTSIEGQYYRLFESCNATYKLYRGTTPPADKAVWIKS